MRDTLQRSDARMMVRAELPEAYSQRQFICAVTFHFLPATRHCVPKTTLGYPAFPPPFQGAILAMPSIF
jgi:hypothetical protein